MRSNLEEKEATASVAADGNVTPSGALTSPPIDPGSLSEMPPDLYDELRRLAASCLRGERVEHTLQRTALVHEAYLRLAGENFSGWQNRAHFLGVFARIMRETLINYAVARTRKKRGGSDPVRMALEFYEQKEIDVTALDSALHRLETVDSRQAQIVELRFFGGLTIEEIASALKVSTSTVKREWAIAKLWLRRELSSD